MRRFFLSGIGNNPSRWMDMPWQTALTDSMTVARLLPSFFFRGGSVIITHPPENLKKKNSLPHRELLYLLNVCSIYINIRSINHVMKWAWYYMRTRVCEFEIHQYTWTRWNVLPVRTTSEYYTTIPKLLFLHQLVATMQSVVIGQAKINLERKNYLRIKKNKNRTYYTQ